LKIVQALSIKPYRYEELRDETRIHRNLLRLRLDDLVFETIIIRHKFRCDPKNKFSKYNGVYFILNYADPKTTKILYSWGWKFKLTNQNILENACVGSGGSEQKFRRILREDLERFGSQRGLTKEDIDRIFSKFQTGDIEEHFRQIEALAPKLEQEKENCIRPLATSLIRVASIDRQNGLSPLDTLVTTTRSIRTKGWFECIWKIMEDAGFLKAYKYRITNFL
jgi:hypothetical protein